MKLLYKKERQTSVPILCQITLQNSDYMYFNLTSFEVTKSHLNKVGVNVQLTL